MNPNLVLATKQHDQLNKLVGREIETLDFELVERNPDSGLLPAPDWMELVPYASISAYDPNNGDLKFAAHQTFAIGLAGDTGAPQLSNTSIGFAAPITTIDHITCTGMTEREDGTKVFQMSMNDLLTTSLTAARANLQDLISVDPIEKFGIDPANTIQFTFFSNTDKEAGYSDRFAVSIPVNLPLEHLAEVYQIANQAEPSAGLQELVVNAGRLLMSFDVSEVASKAIDNMTKDHLIEPWSVQVISQQLLQYFEMMRSHVSYSDIIQAVKKNVEAVRANAEAQNAAMQTAMGQAQEAIALAEQTEAANAAPAANALAAPDVVLSDNGETQTCVGVAELSWGAHTAAATQAHVDTTVGEGAVEAAAAETVADEAKAE